MKFILISLIISLSGHRALATETKSKSSLDDLTQSLIVMYMPTWSDTEATDGLNTKLAKLPLSVNVVNVAFIRPSAVYNGDGDLSETGLDYDGDILKEAMATLRKRNPEVKFIVSIGGWQANWLSFHPDDIARFVKDFNFDGVDIDYEAALPLCFASKLHAKCLSDFNYIKTIHAMRTMLPRPYIVSVAGYPNAAYGVGEFVNSLPKTPATGEMAHVLKKVGADLDLINIMAYNASNYDAIEALHAYRSLFAGKINYGVMVPPEDLGNHVISIDELHRMAQTVGPGGASGFMIWPSAPSKDPSLLDQETILKTMCTDLNKPSCD